MTTIINNPNKSDGDNAGNNSSGGAGILIGAIVVILVLVTAIVLALPYLRERINNVTQSKTPVINNPTVNVQLPNFPGLSTTTIK